MAKEKKPTKKGSKKVVAGSSPVTYPILRLSQNSIRSTLQGDSATPFNQLYAT